MAPREGRVVEHQEDVGVHEVEVAAGGALEATVGAEALEVVVAQVGSVVVVAVAEDSGEVVVVFEGHEIVYVCLRLEFAQCFLIAEVSTTNTKDCRFRGRRLGGGTPVGVPWENED